MRTVLLFCLAAVLLLAILIMNPEWSVATNVVGVFISLGLFALAFLFACSTVSRRRQGELRKHQFDNVSYIRTREGSLVSMPDGDEALQHMRFGIGFPKDVA